MKIMRVPTFIIIIALVMTWFGIKLIIHSTAFSEFLQNIATSHGNMVQTDQKKQSSHFRGTSHGTSTVYQSLTAATLKKAIHVLNPAKDINSIKHAILMARCVPFFFKEKDPVICVYPPEKDKVVSTQIINTGAWELGLLNMTREIYQSEPNMQLLDVGCNVGVFTLTAAILGHHVVALDANKVNLRMLSTSLTLNALHNNVTLVWNAVSDVYEDVELELAPWKENIGGMFVRKVTDSNRTSNITTIKINDLVPAFRGRPVFIKMDIEGSEWKALNGAWNFFREVDVHYVLLEYVFHRGKESGIQIQKFFANFGFLPYKVPQYEEALDPNNDLTWGDELLWIKQKK